jgi:hypothetical protein
MLLGVLSSGAVVFRSPPTRSRIDGKQSPLAELAAMKYREDRIRGFERLQIAGRNAEQTASTAMLF